MGGTHCSGMPEDGSDALLLQDPDAGATQVMQILGRLAFRTAKQEAVYLLVAKSSQPLAEPALGALSEHDAIVQNAVRVAGIEVGRIGRALRWKDLPVDLQQATTPTDKRGVDKRGLAALINS